MLKPVVEAFGNDSERLVAPIGLLSIASLVDLDAARFLVDRGVAGNRHDGIAEKKSLGIDRAVGECSYRPRPHSDAAWQRRTGMVHRRSPVSAVTVGTRCSCLKSGS